MRGRASPVVIASASLLLACTEFASSSPKRVDPTDAGADATIGAPTNDAGSDAAITPARACDPSDPFGDPVALTAINTTTLDEGNASLTDDELTIFFDRPTQPKAGTYEIYSAHRSTTSESFGTPQSIQPMLGGTSIYQPAVTADGSLLFFVSVVAGQTQLYVSTRGEAQVFGGGTHVATDTPFGADDSVPTLVGDGSELWFFSTRSPPHVYRSKRTGTTLSEPVVAPGDENDLPIASSRDGLYAYFRFGPENMGDIKFGTRTGPDERFTINQGDDPTLAKLNTSSADDLPEWLSADGCRLYFTSNQPVQGKVDTTNDLYYAERHPRP